MTREDIIQAIKEMTVLELNELVKAIEEAFGVTAAAAVVAAGGAHEEKEEGPQLVSVVLKSAAANKVGIIKAVKEMLGLSLMDANLRSIGAASKRTVITTTNTLKYLENYGFTVISLEDSKNVTTDLKNSFKNGTYTTLFIKKGETSDTIKDLVDNYKAKTVEVNMMNTLDS